MVAHHALTLGRLLHSYEALEPLLTRQDWLVTCQEKTPFELVVPGRAQVIFHGVRTLVYKTTFRHLDLPIGNVLFRCLFPKNVVPFSKSGQE